MDSPDPAEALATALSDALGHRFAAPERLRRALTHRSAAANPADGYERLEFLGDRALGLCVADMLMRAFPAEAEGPLARRLSALVCQETLAEVAREVGLDQHVIMGGNAGGDPPTGAALADMCEAVIGALYLDGGLAAAAAFVERQWRSRLLGAAPKDAKSALQEWAMARGWPLPAYTEEGRDGPDHAPRFTMRVAVGRPGGPEHAATAEGLSKRAASMRAAAALLSQLEDGGA